MSEIILPLTGGAPTSSSLTLNRTTAGRPYLVAGTAADQTRVWSFKLPDDYSSGATISALCSMASATANNAALRYETMAVTATEAVQSDSFATLEASSDVTVPGTAGNMFEVSKALANTDSMAAGDYVSFIIGRENGTSGTNATGDMHIWAITFEYTPS